MNKTIPIVIYSLLSGLLACSVSLCVKLAFNTELVLNNIVDWRLKLLTQIIFVCVSFVLNAFMWVFYSKSLHLSPNTLYSSALNKFSNFVFSALFGYFLFDEKFNFFYWLFGLVVLLIGILILSEPNQQLQAVKIRN